MAAHEHLNTFQAGKYVRLHRGFAGMHHNQIDTTALGQHWVGDSTAHIADGFATDQFKTGDVYNDESHRGTVLVGFVHKRHIMEPDTEEYEKWANTGYGAVASEEEVPLRPGTPVHLVNATNYRVSGRDTYVPFKKPRRGRA